MLAQNFKSAADLGISEKQLSALIKTLVLLETGKLVHQHYNLEYADHTNLAFSGHFNMGTFGTKHACGTVACIGGTAELVGLHVEFAGLPRTEALEDLFYAENVHHMDDITPAQAAVALRSYLTTGDARWDLAVA